MRDILQGICISSIFCIMAMGESLLDIVTKQLSILPMVAGIAIMTTAFLVMQLYIKKFIRPRMRQKRILAKIRYDSWLHGSY